MATFNFSSYIKIGDLEFNFLHEVEIKSSWKEMTEVATLKIPKKTLIKNADLTISKLTDVIKTGQKVVIKLGYNGLLQTEFVGYVARAPRPAVPVEIYCENEMWIAKRSIIKNKIFANAKLSELVEYILPGYTYEVLDTKLGTNYQCLNEATGTAAGALKKIEDVFGLKSFFRLVPDATQPDGVKTVLIIGKPYSSSDLINLTPAIYKLRATTKSDSLQYKFTEDNPIQIKGIVEVSNGKDLRYAYPPEMVDGSVQTRHYFNISMDVLKQHVEADWIKANIDRYEGDITGFGIPFTRHGQQVNIIDDFYEKRDVFYFIDSVTKRASIGGGLERINTIGYAVSPRTINTFK